MAEMWRSGRKTSMQYLGYEVTPPSRYVDVIDSYNSIAKIKKRAADPQHILLCHDVGLIERMRQNPVIG